MADNIKNICVRFNLNKPLHKKAYEFLKNQSDSLSNSQTIIAAVVDYFESQERENRLVEKITSSLEKSFSGLVTVANHTPSVIVSVNENTVEQDDESLEDLIDYDFLGS